jgi:general secretion pathway protein G
MWARKRIKKAFSLVEILIVAVILGILAAIVIPQFTSASEAAKVSSLISQLQMIRSQLELYQVQHNGNYPTLKTLQSGIPDEWTGLTMSTDVDGTSGSDFGPYLKKSPVNPFTMGTNVAADNSVDWKYNEVNGTIVAVVDATVAAKSGLNTSDFVGR